MKNILIILLGNRDLQIPVTASVSLTYRDRLSQNNDDKEFYTINKTQQSSFLETSEMIWNDYGNFEKVITFPMIAQTIEHIKQTSSNLDKIIFCTSKQSPLDAQDCHYVAEFANKYFTEKGFKTEYLPFSCNPTSFTELLDFFLSITNQYKEDKLYFGNSGGTADMKAASYFSGVFKNIEFTTINARTKQASQNNFKKQEQTILKHIIENMLDSFDYGGITQLPINNAEIIHLSNYAIARIALDYEQANDIATTLNDSTLQISSSLPIKDLEKEVFISAKIKFRQKSYGDYLWRLFTIYDNIYIPILEDFFGNKIIYNRYNGHKEWLNLLDTQPTIKLYLQTKTIKDRPLKWEEPNKCAYEIIYKKIIEDGLIPKPDYIDNITKNLNAFSPLRNAIAHNYKGIGLKQIKDNLVKKVTPTIEDFNILMSSFVNVPFEDFQIFDQVNQKIKKLL